MLVLSKARRNWRGPTLYHYISIEVERARFRVPRRFSSKSWKIQSASRSKRYANEHPGHERDHERGYDYFHCFSIPSGKHRVRSGCFRSSSANLFPRLLLSSFPPNNVSLLPFNFPPPLSFPTLRVYTSSIPPSTSFYFILTTIKLRDKDRGEERSVEINEFRPVSTSFLRFDCF